MTTVITVVVVVVILALVAAVVSFASRPPRDETSWRRDDYDRDGWDDEDGYGAR